MFGGQSLLSHKFALYLIVLLFSIKPSLDIFWFSSFSGFKLIWLPYIFQVFLIALLTLILALNRKIEKSFLVVIVLVLVFCFEVFLGNAPSIESFIRIILSIIILASFSRACLDTYMFDNYRPILFLFVIGVCISLIIAVLQVAGLFPNYEFDWVDGLMVPRATGGYSKPTNFGAYVFPLFVFLLAGIRGVNGRGKRFLLIVLAAAILAFFLVSVKYRTWSIIFVIATFVTLFWRQKWAIPYKKCFSIFFMLLFFFYIFIYVNSSFFIEENWLLRGRVSNWAVHLVGFFESDILTILLGQGKVFTDYYGGLEAGFAVEFHSDFGRVLVTYGLIGFLLLYYFIYNLFSIITSLNYTPFGGAALSIFIGYLLYSITNEPIHYPSIILSFYFGIISLLYLKRKYAW